MTGEELRKLREREGMSQTAFGKHLAKLVNANRDKKHQPVKPYDKNYVSGMERDKQAVPEKIVKALLLETIDDMRKKEALHLARIAELETKLAQIGQPQTKRRRRRANQDEDQEQFQG